MKEGTMSERWNETIKFKLLVEAVDIIWNKAAEIKLVLSTKETFLDWFRFELHWTL